MSDMESWITDRMEEIEEDLYANIEITDAIRMEIFELAEQEWNNGIAYQMDYGRESAQESGAWSPKATAVLKDLTKLAGQLDRDGNLEAADKIDALVRRHTLNKRADEEEDYRKQIEILMNLVRSGKVRPTAVAEWARRNLSPQTMGDVLDALAIWSADKGLKNTF